MRNSVIILFLFFFFSACNESKKDEESKTSSNQYESIETKNNQNTSPEDRSSNQSDTDSRKEKMGLENDSKENSENSSNTISGLYLNSDHQEDSDCNCYCIDVKTSGTSELCLTEDKLYINGRFEQSGNNINIYYSGKSSGNSDNEIPWDKFETGTPIAVLSPTNNGFELDWKGFSINGEIAIDYALYGKKTLEGTYKKK